MRRSVALLVLLSIVFIGCKEEEPEIKYVPLPGPADPAAEADQLEDFCRDQGAVIPYVDPITGKCTFPEPTPPPAPEPPPEIGGTYEDWVQYCASIGADPPFAYRDTWECAFD